MSNTPLMSEFPEDKKALYPLDESDVELKVGEPRSRCGGCFWSRFRRARCNADGERKPRSPLRRAIRWFLTLGLLFGLVGFFTMKHHGHHFHKFHDERHHPIICVPITDTTTTVDLPVAPFTHLNLHPSLTSNDVKVTHSDKVANHTVSISFDLPKDKDLRDDKDEAKYYVCHIANPKFVSLGVHAAHPPPKDGDDKHHDEDGEVKHHRESKHYKLKKDHDDHPAPPHDGPHHPPPHGGPHHPPPHHGPLVKAVSTTITFPAAAAGHPHSISFGGPRPGFFGRKFGRRGGCMNRRIKKAIAKAQREEKINSEEIMPFEEAM